MAKTKTKTIIDHIYISYVYVYMYIEESGNTEVLLGMNFTKISLSIYRTKNMVEEIVNYYRITIGFRKNNYNSVYL